MNLVEQIHGVLSEQGPKLTDDAALILHEDIQKILMDEEQLESPETVGSGLRGADGLKSSTVSRKYASNAPYPFKPRVRTMGMLESIHNVPQGLLSEVFVGDSDSEKVNYQQGTRPFFGISDRAMEKEDQMIRDAEPRIQQALNQIQPEEINVTV